MDDCFCNFFFSIPYYFVLYIFQFHKKMKEMKAASNWTESKTETIIVDTNFRNRKLIYSYGWFAIAFVITAVTFILTVMYYDRIPSEIPMQYGFDRSSNKLGGKVIRKCIGIAPHPIIYARFIYLYKLYDWSQSPAGGRL